MVGRCRCGFPGQMPEPNHVFKQSVGEKWEAGTGGKGTRSPWVTGMLLSCGDGFCKYTCIKNLSKCVLSNGHTVEFSSVGKESTCNAGDPSSIPRSERSAGEGTGYPLQYSWASLVVQLVENLPAMWEIWFLSLGWEDPLEKGEATQL